MSRILLLPASLVVLGLLARGMADQAWHGFVSYESPYGFAGAEGSPPTPPIVPRVVLLLVDGLGYAPSLEMPHLNELRQKGSSFRCRVGLPSLSLPGRAVLLTGAWQEVSGQTTNFQPRPLRVQSLFDVARKAGRSTLLAAGSGTQTLVGAADFREVLEDDLHHGARDMGRYESQLRETAARVRRVLTRADFVYGEFETPDQAGHDWGARSEQYKKAARLVDDEIGRVAAALDPLRSVLVVTADHGHTPRGGHGGPELEVLEVPLVLAGKGILRGIQGRAEQVDVAPTLAALLGTEIPASSEGTVLFEALAVQGQALADLRRSLCEQKEAFAASYAALLVPGSPLTRGDCSHPLEEAAASDRAARSIREERCHAERRTRTLWAALLVGAFAAVGWAAHRTVGRAEALMALAAGGLGLALYQALMPAVGLAYSFSALNDESQLGAFFMTDMALGVGVLIVLLLLVGFSYGPRADLAWLASFDYVGLFVVRAAALYAGFGIFARWRLPDPVWGFVFYLDALVILAVGLASPLAPLVGRLGARLRP